VGHFRLFDSEQRRDLALSQLLVFEYGVDMAGKSRSCSAERL
jgi:hypothetical protein